MRVLHVFDHRLEPDGPAMSRARATIEAQRRLGWAPAVFTLPPRLMRDPDGAGLAASWARGADAALLRRAVAQHRPELLHAHAPFAAARAALLAGRREGLPVVYEIDAAEPGGIIGLGRRGERRALARLDALIAPDRTLRDELRALSGRPVFRAPDPLDPRNAPPAAPRDLALEAAMDLKRATVIGWRGRLAPASGLETLIEALARLRRKRPDVTLLALGDGAVDEVVAVKRTACGRLDGAALFPAIGPARERERLAGLIDIEVIMADPSADAEPRLVRALAAGRLVVADDGDGRGELISNGRTGWLCRADDPASLEAALIHALAAAERWPAIRAAARSETLAHRSADALAERYQAAYRAALSSGPRALRSVSA